jgi:ABC-2 type transport system ATP-binding protein
MTNALELQNVSQSFRVGFWLRPKLILNRVELVVPAGSIFGFLGANGAGKTTLIHLITGLKSPVSGSVKVFGLPATSRAARAKMGYLPERPYFHEHLSGERFLKYYGALSGIRGDELDFRIAEVLNDVGMTRARGTELKRYSKGMLQRIGIAQALLHNPPLLVLDEPMSGLDPVGRREIRQLIKGLAEDGRTIFMTSHVIPDVEALCDRVALIQKGRIIDSGPLAQFQVQGNLEQSLEALFEGGVGHE